MLKTIIRLAYEWKGTNTWEQTLTHDRSDWNTCTKSTRLQGLINNYNTFQTLQVEVTAECYCKKRWETSENKTLPKMQNTSTNSTVQLSVTLS